MATFQIEVAEKGSRKRSRQALEGAVGARAQPTRKQNVKASNMDATGRPTSGDITTRLTLLTVACLPAGGAEQGFGSHLSLLVHTLSRMNTIDNRLID